MILTQENRQEVIAEHPDWWPVGVLPEHAEWINRAGIARNENGKRNGWTTLTKNQGDAWHIAGVAAEWTVSRILNIPINAILIGRDQTRDADLGGFIEVKASVENISSKWDLIESEYKLKGDRVYVHCLTCLYPEWVICTGWAWGREILEKGRSAPGNKGQVIRVLDWRKLRPIMRLFDVLREKNGDQYEF